MTLELDRIYCGDCLELMKEIPDRSIDLVLTDPPYGIGEAAGKNKHRGGPVGFDKRSGRSSKTFIKSTDFGVNQWDNSIPSPEYFSEIFRVSKNQIIFGGNFFGLPASPCWIVWDKDNPGDFADCELAWTSFKSAVRKFKYRWNGMLQEDMKHKEIRYHPTQKPVRLFMAIMENYSTPDQLILDPFLGSGTTAIACKMTGRRFIGIEQIPEYVEIARKRIAAIPARLDRWVNFQDGADR